MKSKLARTRLTGKEWSEAIINDSPKKFSLKSYFFSLVSPLCLLFEIFAFMRLNFDKSKKPEFWGVTVNF